MDFFKSIFSAITTINSTTSTALDVLKVAQGVKNIVEDISNTPSTDTSTFLRTAENTTKNVQQSIEEVGQVLKNLKGK